MCTTQSASDPRWWDLFPQEANRSRRPMRPVLLLGLMALLQAGYGVGRAAVLWSDPGATLIYDSGLGRDILEGAIRRDDTAGDTLYFKFHVDPLSDSTTEEYFAAFQLFEGDQGRLGVGNAPAAWAYSAFFNTVDLDDAPAAVDYVDLHSSIPSAPEARALASNELPRRGVERTIVFKVQYVPGGEDLVTVWLNPDLSAGATELLQSDSLTTRFTANASFDEIRLRHGGGGEGWVFSDLVMATGFVDLVDPSSAIPQTTDRSPFFEQRRIRFRSWQREPGMPRAAISSLAQTTDGYLWLAAGDQIARFDGVRFVPFNVPVLQAGGSVRDLHGDSQGGLWIATDRGVTRFVEGRFELLTTGQGLPDNTVTALCEDRQGRIWVGTELGLAVWDLARSRFVEGLERFEGHAIRALCADGNGVVWIAVHGRGVFRFENGEFSPLNDSALDDSLRDPQCLMVDHEQRVWLGLGDDLVLCREQDRWHRYRIPSPSRTPHVRTLVEAEDGIVWAASSTDGLFQFKEGKLVTLHSDAGFVDNQALALFRDQQGNLWVGGGSGLYLLHHEHLFKLGPSEGLGHGPVSALAEVSPGVIWALQPGRGLSRWEGRTFRRLTAAHLAPDDRGLGAMLVARDGACWIARTNGLLLVRDPQAVADESQFFELSGVQISALAEGPDGSLWAGTLEGRLWRLWQGQWVKHPQFHAAAAVTTLVAAPDGSVWVGTDGDGLYHADASELIPFGAREDVSTASVHALHRDSDGVLWIAAADQGLLRLNNDRLTGYQTGQGLPDDTVLGVLEDHFGRLWLNEPSGLICLAKPSSADPKIDLLRIYPTAPARSRGGSWEKGPSLLFPQGCATSENRLWFATMDGVQVVEPPRSEHRPEPPVLLLESLLVDGVPLADFRPRSSVPRTGGLAPGEPDELEIGPGRHRLELQFTSPELAEPERFHFRYRLLGLDPDWVEAGTARSALYNYLPHGDYEFAVEVVGPAGASSQLRLGLSVLPYFWQRGWVIAAMALGMAAILGGSARFAEKRRLSHRLRQLEHEHALERERTRIARDLHDEMGAKLCRISYLSEHACRLPPHSEDLKEQIGTIAGDARELLQSLDQIVWVVNPQNDTLEHLISYMGQYAQRYFDGTDIDCSLNLCGEFPHAPVSSQARHHLLLALHEALTNVLKHSGASRVEVVIAWRDSQLNVDVRDNGSGFVLADPGVIPSDAEDGGNGLLNMQARLASVGGRCRVDTAPGRGTHIHFEMTFTPPKQQPHKP